MPCKSMERLPVALDSCLLNLPPFLESELVPDLLDDPRKEHERRSDLDGVELDLVEEPVRIEAAALHTTSFSTALTR